MHECCPIEASYFFIMHAGNFLRSWIKLLRSQNHNSWNKNNQFQVYYRTVDLVSLMKLAQKSPWGTDRYWAYRVESALKTVANLNSPGVPPFQCCENISFLCSCWQRYMKRFNLLCKSLVNRRNKQVIVIDYADCGWVYIFMKMLCCKT